MYWKWHWAALKAKAKLSVASFPDEIFFAGRWNLCRISAGGHRWTWTGVTQGGGQESVKWREIILSREKVPRRQRLVVRKKVSVTQIRDQMAGLARMHEPTVTFLYLISPGISYICKCYWKIFQEFWFPLNRFTRLAWLLWSVRICCGQFDNYSGAVADWLIVLHLFQKYIVSMAAADWWADLSNFADSLSSLF